MTGKDHWRALDLFLLGSRSNIQLSRHGPRPKSVVAVSTTANSPSEALVLGLDEARGASLDKTAPHSPGGPRSLHIPNPRNLPDRTAPRRFRRLPGHAGPRVGPWTLAALRSRTLMPTSWAFAAFQAATRSAA
eukprot:CAMPEP_0180022680 /NCGR_PEP_ID=MMETSP0984-20121128/23004_1 /TAXON_ID=483367 /ORGANISM="non described non described, Strain CCMP 2436" /LENGTH=132 /DNA_ID=CAMNT_0021946767 /DNA_START=491 /DNA_END=887 /DNA_ORIENTATION=-